MIDALIVGASPSVPSPDSLRDCAAAAGLIVAVDGGANALSMAGVVPDVFVGDVDSTSPLMAQRLSEAGVDVHVHPAAKDASDLHLALAECERRSVHRVTVMGVSGGRLDHELSALGILAQYGHLRPQVVSDDQQIWILAEDGLRELCLEGEHRLFSVLAMGDQAMVSVTGARWRLDRATLEPLSDHGLSNVISAQGARITLHRGRAVIIAPGEASKRAVGRPA